MVEARITDGFRIAELLASEVDGRTRGPLGRLAVANADRSVEGSPAGERAYEVRFLAGDRDPRREPTPDDVGTLLARTLVHDEGVSVEVLAGADAAAATARDAGLSVEHDPADVDRIADDSVVIGVAAGAQVKRAADALAAASRTVREDD